MFKFCPPKKLSEVLFWYKAIACSLYFNLHTWQTKVVFTFQNNLFLFSDEDMLSVASMMSLNEMDNFEFDDEKRSSMKKINRLSGSANLNDTGK